MNTRFSRIPVHLLAGVIGGLLLAGQVPGIAGYASAADRRPVWERLDQFIAVEKQERGATPNDQPAQLSPDVIRRTLGALQVRIEGEKPVPLFTAGELEVMCPAAAEALATAGPAEDVTFALVGLHPTMLGFVKRPLVTTGRLFFRQERLNLILGTVHELVKDSDDRRLKPFIPGSRAQTARPAWRVTAGSGEEVALNAERPDWLVLPLAAAPPVMEPEVKGEAPAKTEPSAPSETAPRPAGRSMEERLMILNELHNKKLITDEEYRQKRLDILKEL